jgi:methylenetetrahydrofolate dehydrogenase (NADP+)/methenyltetrahydrofolate cyclohydrolase
MTQVIDGKAVAEKRVADISRRSQEFFVQNGVKPGLAVVIVGEDPASKVYVRSKAKRAVECGFNSFKHELAETVSEAELLALVQSLNNDASVHGILVQLPLPKHINAQKVLDLILPQKDVDGFHPVNAGLLSIGDQKRALVPCTPAGCIVLLAEVQKDLSGLHAVVIGRSNIVGKPIANLLLQANCTVSICHSRTKDMAAITRQADILVAAVGIPEFVKADMVKQGVIVIDVGINRVNDPSKGEGGSRLVGDVAYDEVAVKASAITPVPGGVGPMTIAMLMENTLKAASLAQSLN